MKKDYIAMKPDVIKLMSYYKFQSLGKIDSCPWYEMQLKIRKAFHELLNIRRHREREVQLNAVLSGFYAAYFMDIDGTDIDIKEVNWNCVGKEPLELMASFFMHEYKYIEKFDDLSHLEN
jgi:hypothetical protein